MLPLRRPLPEFRLRGYVPSEGELLEVSRADLEGSWTLLATYPADFDPFSTLLLLALLDGTPGGARALALGTDKLEAHVAWARSERLLDDVCFPLLSDPSATLVRALGALDPSSGRPMPAVFLISPEVRVAAVSAFEPRVCPSPGEIRRTTLAFMAEGEGVFPPDWEPGGEPVPSSLDLAGRLYTVYRRGRG